MLQTGVIILSPGQLLTFHSDSIQKCWQEKHEQALSCLLILKYRYKPIATPANRVIT